MAFTILYMPETVYNQKAALLDDLFFQNIIAVIDLPINLRTPSGSFTLFTYLVAPDDRANDIRHGHRNAIYSLRLNKDAGILEDAEWYAERQLMERQDIPEFRIIAIPPQDAFHRNSIRSNVAERALRILDFRDIYEHGGEQKAYVLGVTRTIWLQNIKEAAAIGQRAFVIHDLDLSAAASLCDDLRAISSRTRAISASSIAMYSCRSPTDMPLKSLGFGFFWRGSKSSISMIPPFFPV
jgi:hypothetical protein